MPVHIIRIFRDLSDVGSRQESAPNSFFYKDVGRLCTGTWEPNTDIYETDDDVVIRLELAGVSKEDVSVRVKDGKLVISGVRHAVESGDQKYFHQMEIHCGEFNKIIALPQMLEHNDMSAQLQEGLLEIRISKKGQPVEIPITVNARSNQE